MPSISSTRNRTPSASGDPTMSPRKIVRFDQSICPSDRSNTRMAAARNGGAWRTGPSARGGYPAKPAQFESGAVSLI